MKTPCYVCEGICCTTENGFPISHMALELHRHVCKACRDGFVLHLGAERISLTLGEFNALIEEIQQLRAKVTQIALPHPAPTATDEVRRLRDGERILCPDCGFYLYSMRTTGDWCRNCKERQP